MGRTACTRVHFNFYLTLPCKLYRSETGRPDEGYAEYEENGEEWEGIRIKVKEKSYEQKRMINE
jgi:hypothetical protein